MKTYSYTLRGLVVFNISAAILLFLNLTTFSTIKNHRGQAITISNKGFPFPWSVESSNPEYAFTSMYGFKPEALILDIVMCIVFSLAIAKLVGLFMNALYERINRKRPADH